MLRVFRGAGFSIARRTEHGEVSVELRTDVSAAALDASDRREWRSEARSLRPLLAPESVAVVGVRRSAGGIGRAVLDSIVAGGYAGRLSVVHPAADGEGGEIAGLPAYPSVQRRARSARPGHGRGAARRGGRGDRRRVCGRRGRGRRRVVGLLRGLVTTTTGTWSSPGPGPQRPARRPELPGRAQPRRCRSAERVVRARAPRTWRARRGRRSRVGSASRCSTSRATSASACTRSSRSAPSSTCRATTCSPPGATTTACRSAALYLESFGNALKFARTARRFAERKPLLAVVGGDREARGAVGISALFAQAGVIRCRGAAELAEAAAVLSQQPLPGGHRVGIVSNAGGMGWLAASLAEGEGLSVPRLSPGLQESLRSAALAGRRRQPGRRRRRRDAGPAVDRAADTAGVRRGRRGRRAAGADHPGRPAAAARGRRRRVGRERQAGRRGGLRLPWRRTRHQESPSTAPRGRRSSRWPAPCGTPRGGASAPTTHPRPTPPARPPPGHGPPNGWPRRGGRPEWLPARCGGRAAGAVRHRPGRPARARRRGRPSRRPSRSAGRSWSRSLTPTCCTRPTAAWCGSVSARRTRWPRR